MLRVMDSHTDKNIALHKQPALKLRHLLVHPLGIL